MNFKLITGAAALAAMTGMAPVANASTIEILVTVYNATHHVLGTTILAPGSFGEFGLSNFNGFKIVSGSASDSGAQLSSALLVTALAAGRGETLTVAVIESGLLPLTGAFLTGYANVLTPKGWTVKEQTFEGATSIYAPISGTSTGATTGVHSGAFSGGGSSTIAVTAPYSLEELYIVSLSSSATYTKVSSSSTMNLSYTAVPEVSTWAMMLAGFAGLGFVGFSRNQKARVAA